MLKEFQGNRYRLSSWGFVLTLRTHEICRQAARDQKRISFLFRRRSGVHTLSIPECHVLSACGFFRFDTKWRRLLDAAVDQYSAPPEHHINSGMRGTHCSPVSLSRQYIRSIGQKRRNRTRARRGRHQQDRRGHSMRHTNHRTNTGDADADPWVRSSLVDYLKGNDSVKNAKGRRALYKTSNCGR